MRIARPARKNLCDSAPMKACAAFLAGAAASAALAAGSPSGAAETWADYHAIIWQPQKAGSCAALRELGIDAGAVVPEDAARPAQGFEARVAPLRDCGLSWYVENIATDFYSPYHRFDPARPANWRFVEIKDAYRKNPSDPRAFLRDPGLSDPGWQARISERLIETVRVHRDGRPLFYDLGDETGIAGLSAAWDFDYSAASLAGFRAWLKTRYAGLAALNRQWGSRFADWDAVMPETTAEAMARSDGNWSAWADFKEWMDAEFAHAIELGTRAIHSADPGAYSAIEGAQIPGWGGYDYTRLATAVDVLEPYDGGGNVEIARALNPGLVLLTTVAGGGSAQEAHHIWRQLLRGGRGVIFWDPKGEVVGEDGRPGARGRAAAPVLREIKSGIGALLIKSERLTAPVAVLYSPASMRAQWMLDWQPWGSAWSDRTAGESYEDANAVRDSMTAFLDAMGRAALEARIATPGLIEKGALRRGIRVLILPRALALSEHEAREIRAFAAAGGTVIADGVPGQFDEHCRPLAEPRLADLFAAAAAPGARARAIRFAAPQRSERIAELLDLLKRAGVVPALALARPDGRRALDIETQQWRNGAATLVALQRASPEGTAAEPVRVTLRKTARIYDLRARRDLGTTRSFEVALDPVAPALLRLEAPQR